MAAPSHDNLHSTVRVLPSCSRSVADEVTFVCCHGKSSSIVISFGSAPRRTACEKSPKSTYLPYQSSGLADFASRVCRSSGKNRRKLDFPELFAPTRIVSGRSSTRPVSPRLRKFLRRRLRITTVIYQILAARGSYSEALRHERGRAPDRHRSCACTNPNASFRRLFGSSTLSKMTSAPGAGEEARARGGDAASRVAIDNGAGACSRSLDGRRADRHLAARAGRGHHPGRARREPRRA